MKQKKTAAQLNREIGAILHKPRGKKPTFKESSLVATYDVTGLSNPQINELTGHVAVQSEESDTYPVGHPTVAVATRLKKHGKRTRLVATYDITGLSKDQLDALTAEVVAQAERNDAGLIIKGVPQNVVYPSVPVTTKIVRSR